MDAIFVQGNYETVDHTPEDAVAAGDILVLEDKCYIAHLDIAADALGALGARGGIYRVTRTAGTSTANAKGEKAYWDATNSVVGEDSSGTVPLGWFAADTVDADTTALIEHGAW